MSSAIDKDLLIVCDAIDDVRMGSLSPVCFPRLDWVAFSSAAAEFNCKLVEGARAGNLRTKDTMFYFNCSHSR